MAEIKLLDPTVANQIAAGEVVTRPAAVVKELLENSVDAGARNISLSISEAGQAVICVIDDGSGIPASELPLAFARHATSKIRSSQDIFKIGTLGFRGEALASIASVAEVEMKSRTALEETGTKVLVRECQIVSTEEISMPKGTSISVYNLFYNTPARRKFLKSDAYEKRLCIEEFEHVALANPAIGFTLQCDAMQPSVYPPCSLYDRVSMIARKKVAENMFHVSLDTEILKLNGWIASPQFQVQGNRDMYFFVNGRYMNPRLLSKAVTTSYGKLLSDGKSVPCYLYMEVPADSIDVNVHPTKAEIKFDNEREIWDLVRSAVRKAVGSSYEVPELDFDATTRLDIPLFTSGLNQPAPRSSESLRDYNPFQTDDFEDRTPDIDIEAERLPFREDLPAGLVLPKVESQNAQFAPQNVDISHPALFKPDAMEGDDIQILRLSGKWFAFKNNTGLVIVNWSRAQERIEYERILPLLYSSNTEIASQRLLVPEMISFSPIDASTLIDKSHMLAQMGFEIGDMGSGTIALYAVPASLSASSDYREILVDILSEYSQSTLPSDEEKTAVAFAKTYAMRRDCPTDAELKKIAFDLTRCSSAMLTPSSSLSTMWVIPTAEIEKHFKR